MMELLFAITTISLVVAAGASVLAWQVISENRRRSAARVARLADVLVSAEPPEAPPVHVPGLLATAQHTAAPRRLVGVAVLALSVAVALALSWRPLDGRRRPAPADTAVSTAATRPTLELVSLTHERGTDGALELRGEVHNPANGTTLDDVTAVALLFDRQGTFVTSGRAPLVSRSVGANGDATFRISVPDAENIGRYRVSFRTADGIVPHTDRRNTTE